MVQDYHLTLVPRMLADRRPDVTIAHFSHTPWAPPDYYRMLPDDVGREVLDGILGADHAGFLSQRWADAFLDCCEAVLGAEVDRAAAAVGTAATSPASACTRWAWTPGSCASRAAEPDVQAQVAALADGRGRTAS